MTTMTATYVIDVEALTLTLPGNDDLTVPELRERTSAIARDLDRLGLVKVDNSLWSYLTNIVVVPLVRREDDVTTGTGPCRWTTDRKAGTGVLLVPATATTVQAHRSLRRLAARGWFASFDVPPLRAGGALAVVLSTWQPTITTVN